MMSCYSPLSLGTCLPGCVEPVMNTPSPCFSARQAALTLSLSHLLICQHFSPSNDVASERAVVSHPDEI